MLIVGIKDKLAGKFINYAPTTHISVLKRELINVVKDSKSLFCTNSEDFDVYALCDINDETGAGTTECTLLFNLSELKNEVQVQ